MYRKLQEFSCKKIRTTYRIDSEITKILLTLHDVVHSGTVARIMNDLTVSRRDGHVVFVSATNAYRRGIHVAGGFGTKASRRAWHVFIAQVAVNTAVHDSTGYTPAFLDRGRELRSLGGPTMGKSRRHPLPVSG